MKRLDAHLPLLILRFECEFYTYHRNPSSELCAAVCSNMHRHVGLPRGCIFGAKKGAYYANRVDINWKLEGPRSYMLPKSWSFTSLQTALSCANEAWQWGKAVILEVVTQYEEALELTVDVKREGKTFEIYEGVGDRALPNTVDLTWWGKVSNEFMRHHYTPELKLIEKQLRRLCAGTDMTFGELKSGEKFVFPASSFFYKEGEIYMKAGLNASQRIDAAGKPGNVWGCNEPVVKC